MNGEPCDSPRITCPICGAEQERSLSCRRCRGDLSLVIAALESYSESRRRCLQAFASDRLLEAARYARICHELLPNDASRRRLAACLALTGSAEALQIAAS